MPLGILPSGAIGDVASPAKILVMLASGLRGEAAWGSANALQLLAGGLIGTAAGITWIGAATGPGSVVSGMTVADVPLPAGAQAGDVALITFNSKDLSAAFVPTTPDMSTVLAPTLYDSSSYRCYLAAYLYTLTTADITEGKVTVTGSQVSGMTAVFDIFRGSSLTADAVGTVASGAIAKGATVSMTAPGITTAVEGAVAVYVAALRDGGITLTIGSTPNDFTLDMNASYYVDCPQALSHHTPAPPGATGNATMTGTVMATYGTATVWGAVLIALKPAGALAPFAITGTFPAGTVGAPWEGVLTFSGDYTGPVVMDTVDDNLPAWITSVVVDETAKTATYSGTPDAAQSYSFTPRGTPAIGSPATAAQTFVVAVATAGDYFDPARVDSNITLSDSNKTATGNVFGWKTVLGVTAYSSGIHYFEIIVAGGTRFMCGVGNENATTNNYLGNTSSGWGALSSGNKYHGGSNGSSGIGSYVAGDVFRCVYNGDTKKLWFGKNATMSGDPVAGTGEAFSGVTGLIVPGFSPESKSGVGTLRVKNIEFAFPIAGINSWSGL